MSMFVAPVEVQTFSHYAVGVQYVTAGVDCRQKDSSVNDQALLMTFKRAVESQDQAAWREIWQRYHPVIAQRLRRELRDWVVDGEDIRDLTQTVFIKFWEDSRTWDRVDRLYSRDGCEGILSRLHSTAIFTVQRFRQSRIRKWIPVIRINYPLCSEANRAYLRNLAGEGLSRRYRDIFLLHLRGCDNPSIAELTETELRDVSIQINRAWERFVYVMLAHRQQNTAFDALFQHLIAPGKEVGA